MSIAFYRFYRASFYIYSFYSFYSPYSIYSIYTPYSIYRFYSIYPPLLFFPLISTSFATGFGGYERHLSYNLLLVARFLSENQEKSLCAIKTALLLHQKKQRQASLSHKKEINNKK